MAGNMTQAQEEADLRNPLTHYVVLQNLLPYDKSPKTILRNRLVCKNWKDASKHSWKQLEKSLVLRYSQPKIFNGEEHPSKQLMTLHEYCVELQNRNPELIELVPPKKMNLYEWERFAGDSNMSELDSMFWSPTATCWLTELTLTDCHFREDVPIYKQAFLQTMPNLKSLALKNCVVYQKAVNIVNHEAKETSLNAETLYQHKQLHNLDMELSLCPEAANQPLKIWNLLLLVFPQVKSFRLGGVIYKKGEPCHFRDLACSPNFDNFARRLTSLNLLDFAGVAQEHCLELPQANIFENLDHMALDIGICPYLAHADIRLVRRRVKHVTLYRAPFARKFPESGLPVWVDTLELWGNVVPNLNFRNVGIIEHPRKLIWNTRCYEEKFHGKRIQHLLKASRRSYPLFTKDLIEDSDIWRLQFLTYLEIDFGPLSVMSWNRLGQCFARLTTLKAVFGENVQLKLAVYRWPNLVCLELKHRSSISAKVLLRQLQKLKSLTEFRWKSCACTQTKFKDAILLRKVHKECRRIQQVELPWKWTGCGDELVCEEICQEAEFESALLLAADNHQLMDTSVGDEL